MESVAEKSVIRRLHPEDHAETAATEVAEVSDGNFKLRPASFWRSLFGMWIGGAVGSLLTLMTVAYPLGAGDTVAALSMLPLALTLIAIVNGWIAANLFLDSELQKP